jgi:hypothetical protein
VSADGSIVTFAASILKSSTRLDAPELSRSAFVRVRVFSYAGSTPHQARVKKQAARSAPVKSLLFMAVPPLQGLLMIVVFSTGKR